jgi:hypothetical protein
MGRDSAAHQLPRFQRRPNQRLARVVSCSDIVFYAARDATKILSKGHINYEVPAGRLDGQSQQNKSLGSSLQNYMI